jgi:deoxyribonuclease-2
LQCVALLYFTALYRLEASDTKKGSLNTTKSHPSCLNSAGDPVDWFVALKKPNGAVTVESFGGVLSESASGMDGTSGNLVVNTVKQIYSLKAGSAVGVAVYNDDTDDGSQNSGKAHSKGVIGFDTTQGFWLIHSLPRYPNRRSTGYGPLPTITFGQSFLCITLTTASFEDVGAQLQIIGPQFYDSTLSPTLTTKLPSFAAALAGTAASASTGSISFHSLGGLVFHHLAKSKNWGMELYENLVAPEYGDLIVETWMNGDDDNKIPSSCKGKDGNKYEVLDVTNMTIDDVTWTETQDHSKWAIGQTSKSFCVGDINRQKSQASRGGGTMCHADVQVWQSFRDAATGLQEC